MLVLLYYTLICFDVDIYKLYTMPLVAFFGYAICSCTQEKKQTTSKESWRELPLPFL